MALSMSRPIKHSKTGVYYYRKAVPDDLRAVVGKREWKETLKTKDPAEARRNHVAVASRSFCPGTGRVRLPSWQHERRG
jgi:hypothetical protein